MSPARAITLTSGAHEGPSDGLCLMEAAALFAGEPHGDRPDCVCPVLIEFGWVINDALSDDLRTELLLPLVPLLVGTRDAASLPDDLSPTALERDRANLLLAWALCTLPGVSVAAAGEEQRRRDEALTDATDWARFGQVRRATRCAADALAWTVKGHAPIALTRAMQRHSHPGRAINAARADVLCLWRSAVSAYREAAVMELRPFAEKPSSATATIRLAPN